MNAFNRPEMAFPWDAHLNQCGMTLRDYFAAQAITSTLPGRLVKDEEVDVYARLAYRMADAMIRAREAS